ncbi:DUF4350 domain-containing protein [Schaalia suimastitidis]|uniref:DUF4350 domain-containing protein n=1 Tax=Schaalia suimastitidis TaxID=121163 RepID=UPI0003FC6C14|nr:DUF4350 domain-containing protein [Schaalia suimastitidis]
MRATQSTVITPTARTFSGRVKAAAAIAGIILFGIIGLIWIPSVASDTVPYSANNAGGNGAQALARVLQDHGVKVTVAQNGLHAQKLGQEGATVAVVLPSRMSAEVTDAMEALPSVVYIGVETLYTTEIEGKVTPQATWLQDGHPLQPSCHSSAATKAEMISPRGYGVTLSDSTWTGCFPLESGVYAYAERDTGGLWRAVIGDSKLVTNDFIAEHGNAALAINALGRTQHVAWFIPSFSDDMTDPPDFSPTFLNPWIVVLTGATLLLAVAYGRRLGRLVHEDLATPVPAAETVIGKGRLLKSSRDYAHTAQLLRHESADRLCRRLGLSRTSTAEELHRALTGRGLNPEWTYQTLWGNPPQTKAELYALSNALSEIEKSLTRD